VNGVGFKSGMSNALLSLGGLLIVLVATLLGTRNPAALGVVAVVVGVVTIALSRPQWLVFVFMLSAFLTLPDGVPRVIPFLGIGLYLYEPFLYLTLIYLLVKSVGFRLPLPLVVFSLSILTMVIIGIANENGRSAMIADTRPLIDLAVAAVVAFLYLSNFSIKPVLSIVQIILWTSFALTVLGSTLGLGLAGRADENTESSERLITGATYFSLAVVTVAVALLVSGTTRLKQVLPFIAPAVFILLLSFSRNNLLGIAVAVVWGILVARDSSRRISGAGRFLGLVSASGLLVAFVLALGLSPWLQEQIDGFSFRVLGGLSSESQLDSGRDYENQRIVPVIAESPIVGNGVGAVYKEAYGPADGFYANRGRAYAHNFYLWLLLKGGAVALLAFMTLVAFPLVRIFRSRTSAGIGVTASLIAFLAVSVVAPMAIGFPTAALLGLLIGASYYFTTKPANSDHEIPGV
jgi:O-antigen ligase